MPAIEHLRLPGDGEADPPLDSPSPVPSRGRVVTFYSYKGGVGRSMALASVAALLAKWGHRVLVVDWDLEAPGLEKYFERAPSTVRGSRAKTPGVLDLLLAVQRGERIDWRDCRLQAIPYDGRKIDLISAGRTSETYVEDVQHLDWDRLFAERDLGAFLHQMRQEWAQQYDFVLIDSRTGINDIGGICTILLPDILVLLFTSNEQSVHGVREVFQRARRARTKLPVDLGRLLAIPVPARDESRNEYRESRQWKDRFAEDLAELYADWLPPDRTPRQVLSKLYVPYWANWSFGESLPVVEEPDEIEDPATLSAAYARLATLLANGLDWQKVEGSETLALAEERAAGEAAARTTLRRWARYLAGFGVAALTAFLAILGPWWISRRTEAKARVERIVSAAEGVKEQNLDQAALLLLELGPEAAESGRALQAAREVAASLVPHLVLRGHRGEVSRAVFLADGSRILTAGKPDLASEATLRIWDAESGRLLHTLDHRLAGRDEIPTLVSWGWALSGDGRRALTASEDGHVAVWQTTDGRLEAQRKLPGELLATGFDDNGRGVVVMSADRQTIRIYDAASGRELGEQKQESSAFAALSPGSRYLAIERAGQLEVREVQPSGGTAELAGSVRWAAFSPDARYLAAVVAGSGKSEVFQAACWWETARLGEDRRGSCLDYYPSGPLPAFSPDSRYLLIPSDRDRITLRNLRGDNRTVYSHRFSEEVGAAAMSTKNDLLAAVMPGQIRFFWSFGGDYYDMERLSLQQHGEITGLSFSPDDRSLAAGLADGTAWIWRLRPSPEEARIRALGRPVDEAAWPRLVSYLRSATNDCLSVQNRLRVLDERQSEAERNFADCRRRAGQPP